MIRPTLKLFASAGSSVGNVGTVLSRHPLALLPPIPLYRRLLRSHRKFLPKEERVLGDMYIKEEWRRHREVENPVHIIGFLTEWQLYAQQLEGGSWRDEKLDEAKLDKMSGIQYTYEQIGQLYELMKNVKMETDGEGEDGTNGSGGPPPAPVGST